MYAMCMLSPKLSHVWLFATPWTVAQQAPLSMGILQARILEWVAIPFSRGSFQPRDWIQVSHITGRFFTVWDTREVQYVNSNLKKKDNYSNIKDLNESPTTSPCKMLEEP